MSAAAVASLYEIEDTIAALLNSRETVPDDEPGLKAELEEAIDKWVQAELRKADSVCHVLVSLERQADLAADEIKRLGARKKRFEGQVARLEASVQRAMELRGVLKIEGDTNTLCLQPSPASVVILDETQIPLEFKRHVPESWEPAKALISKTLKAGGEVPGCDLSEGNMHLVRK